MKTHLLKAYSSFFTLCLLALTPLSSCKKDNEPNPAAKHLACKMTKFSTDSREYSVYEYDNQNRLLKTTRFWEGNQKALENYEYNEQGQIVKQIIKDKYLDNQGQFTIEVTDVYTMEYNTKGQLAKWHSERTSPQSGSYARKPYEITCEYDLEGYRTKTIQTYQGSTTQNVSVFNHQNGNYIKAVFSQGTPSEYVAEYEYYLDQENKLKTQYGVPVTLLESPSNNMLKKESTTFKQNPDISNTLEYSYEYNEKGFPTKRTTIYTTSNYSSTTTTLLEYQCQ